MTEKNINIKETIEKVALSALLHDIGKFWQRTGQEKPFSQQEKEYFNTYEHALWSGCFIEKYVNEADIYRWALHHHIKELDEWQMKVIKLSDWLSSGERNVFEHVKNQNTEAEPPTCRNSTARLENIFDNLELDNNKAEKTNQKTYFKLSKYPDYSRDNFFPQSFHEGNSNEYTTLWNEFITDLKFLGWSETNKLNLPYSTWLSLLKKYTSRIPSATPTQKQKIFPDISLFQHLRITSAISACLSHSYLNKTITDNDIDQMINSWSKNLSQSEPSANPDTNDLSQIEVATFLCGDISGIQEYIYSIPTKGATKQLKARSFLLQLICEFIAIYICEQFDLPPANIIYSGGGRFFILLPKNAKEKVEELNKKISDELLNYMKGDLHLLLATTPVKLSHFEKGKFTEVWKSVTREIGKRKQQKYSIFQTEERYNDIFGTMDKNKYPVSEYFLAGNPEEDDSQQMEEIGKNLRNAKWMVRKIETKVNEDNPPPLQFINSLGFNYEFYNELKEINLDNVVEITFLDKFDITSTITQILCNKYDKISLAFRPFASYWPSLKENLDVNKRPLEKDDNRYPPLAPAQFKDFAKTTQGPEKIAIFRADVDSLGEIFQKGLSENNTLSRSAMLSSALSDFFEGYINHLAQQESYKGTIGIVYSGGDDLFIVGSWDKVIDFAFQLREDFSDYTHERLSFSGGIIIIEDSIPIRLSAKMAEAAESQAKSYTRNISNNGSFKENKKDAIVIFDTPIGYEEKDTILKIKEQLLKLSAEEINGVINKLFEIINVYQKQKAKETKYLLQGLKDDEIKKLVVLDRWKWLLVYGLRKYTKKESDANQIITEIITEIQDDLLNQTNRAYKLEDKLGAVLRWVEFLTRDKKD
ncbi:MAG TPA: type III-A CRISPR-associated protein Cas10/Csm1 [Candidatus Hydrogenedens sp.]|nr:type III-A CRISPR-associated protein Cas10/Csm1 [Candidatus Hydrogenedens sp.]